MKIIFIMFNISLILGHNTIKTKLNYFNMFFIFLTNVFNRQKVYVYVISTTNLLLFTVKTKSKYFKKQRFKSLLKKLYR